MLPGLSMPMMRRRFTESAVLAADGIAIGNMTSGGGLAGSFDGDTAEGTGASRYTGAGDAWLGKTWDTPRKFSRAKAWPHSSQGFSADIADGVAITLSIRGKNGAAPTTPGEGDLIASLATVDGQVSREITGGSFAPAYLHWWLVINGGSDQRLSELELWELL